MTDSPRTYRSTYTPAKSRWNAMAFMLLFNIATMIATGLGLGWVIMYCLTGI